ncbi:hypothetical protein GCM10027456_50450 [Kineosporia babensis]
MARSQAQVAKARISPPLGSATAAVATIPVPITAANQLGATEAASPARAGAGAGAGTGRKGAVTVTRSSLVRFPFAGNGFRTWLVTSLPCDPTARLGVVPRMQ